MIPMFLLASSVMAQRRLVVINVESKVPVRDVKVSTDDGQEVITSWDGCFAVSDSCHRLDFSHPDFEHRYVLNSELRSDTIFLIPNMNAIREVVVYGHRRFDERMAQMMQPSEEQRELAKLPKVIPSGPDVFAIASWLYGMTIGKNRAERSRRKKALQKVREKELELEQKWDSLKQSK